ncbi:MAG: hypothetical protein SGARI_005816 [Bacillariaceae sp.]
MVVRDLSVNQILHAESYAEKQAREIRKEQKLPQKIYQRDPVNHDFIDPFGVDHDDFVMCGKLADLCEPDFDDVLDQPQVYAITQAPAATRATETKSEEPAEPKQEEEQESTEKEDLVRLLQV